MRRSWGRRLGFSRTFLDNLEDFLVEADVGEGLRDGADGPELAALVVVVLLALGGSLLLLLLLLLPHVHRPLLKPSEDSRFCS
jgi:hypothetical protein